MFVDWEWYDYLAWIVALVVILYVVWLFVPLLGFFAVIGVRE